VKIEFTSVGCVPAVDLERNEDYARRLGFPKWSPAASQRLAVVGGGPSIADHMEELAAWDGDIWAINGAFKWCAGHGIDAVFFTIDPQPATTLLAVNVERAILATTCHPSLFDALRVADVEAFKLGPAGATTATAAPFFAAEKGYRSVTFFGCESSYGGETHAYQHDKRDLRSLLRVRCNGQEFLTTPDMLMQTEFLGGLIRQAQCFHERSGGLLEAFIASPEIDVIAATQRIHDALVVHEV
jgi:hypothetical protein